MWATLPTTALLLCTTTASDDYGVFCPDSANDNTIWNDLDIGINIWSSSDSREDDCFLRVSFPLYNDHSSIGTEWINPSNNIIVLSHGWQPFAYLEHLSHKKYDHYISDQWGYFESMSTSCVNDANEGDVEKCAPMDHDAQYWIENGWNVLYVDWIYFAATLNVVDGEKHIYNEVLDGKSVNLLYRHIVEECPSATVQCQGLHEKQSHYISQIKSFYNSVISQITY